MIAVMKSLFIVLLLFDEQGLILRALAAFGKGTFCTCRAIRRGGKLSFKARNRRRLFGGFVVKRADGFCFGRQLDNFAVRCQLALTEIASNAAPSSGGGFAVR